MNKQENKTVLLILFFIFLLLPIKTRADAPLLTIEELDPKTEEAYDIMGEKIRDGWGVYTDRDGNISYLKFENSKIVKQSQYIQDVYTDTTPDKEYIDLTVSAKTPEGFQEAVTVFYNICSGDGEYRIRLNRENNYKNTIRVEKNILDYEGVFIENNGVDNFLIEDIPLSIDSNKVQDLSFTIKNNPNPSEYNPYIDVEEEIEKNKNKKDIEYFETNDIEPVSTDLVDEEEVERQKKEREAKERKDEIEKIESKTDLKDEIEKAERKSSFFKKLLLVLLTILLVFIGWYYIFKKKIQKK